VSHAFLFHRILTLVCGDRLSKCAQRNAHTVSGYYRVAGDIYYPDVHTWRKTNTVSIYYHDAVFDLLLLSFIKMNTRAYDDKTKRNVIQISRQP